MRKGDIYRIHPSSYSHLDQGARLGLVLQADALLKLSTILIAPISQNIQYASFRPKVNIKGEIGYIVIDQMQPIEATRFGQFRGQLSLEENWAVEEAIKIFLGT